MKRYIKSTSRYQRNLDNLVNGNQMWNPFTGEYETIPEETIAEWRNPKPVMLDALKPVSNYTYHDGKLYYVSRNGEQPTGSKVYRNAGRYKIYLDSFRDAALLYSKLRVADTVTGNIYEREVTQGITDFKRDLTELVDWLIAGNEI